MISVTRIDPLSPTALSLIEGSEVEQSALYPPEVRFAFSPQELVCDKVRFYCASLNETPVGCGGYGHYGDYGELKRIFVEKTARGKGLVDALVSQMEQDALGEGLTVMRLETGLASPAAIRAYQRLGYQTIGPFGPYTENGSSVFMEKTL